MDLDCRTRRVHNEHVCCRLIVVLEALNQTSLPALLARDAFAHFARAQASSRRVNVGSMQCSAVLECCGQGIS